MTRTLFDLHNPEPPDGVSSPTLPHQGRTPASRQASREAAAHAAQRRGRLQQRYLDALRRAGAQGLTDHEASAALGCPVSSICSTRAGLGRQVVPHGHRTGPYRERNTVWGLAVVADQPIGGEAA